MPFVSHPIYWMYDRAGILEPSALDALLVWLGRRQFRWYGAVLFVVVFIFILAGPGPFLVLGLGLPIMSLLVGVPLIMLLAGTLYGLISALTISDAITTEKLRGRYALLGLTPRGLPVAMWAIASLALNSNSVLRQVRNTLAWVYVAVASLVGLPFLFGMFMLVLSPSETNTPGTFAHTSLNTAAVILLLFVDYIQSSNQGALIGMIAPALAEGRANTRGYALLLFLSLQFGVYLVIGFLDVLLWRGFQSSLVFTFGALLVYMLVRELVIYILWFGLAHAMEEDVEELNAVIRLKVHALPMAIMRLLR